MKKCLVAYATMSGTTADVAKTIAEELEKKGVKTSILPVTDVMIWKNLMRSY
jgi:flavodoxin